MRRLLQFGVILVLAICALSGTAAADHVTTSDLAGSGTVDDPYQISDVHELQAMRDDLSAHYVIVNDIDASETENWNNGFNPVGDFLYGDGPFEGSLDGQGYTVSNLTISYDQDADSVQKGAALFGHASGHIHNVTIKDADISMSDSSENYGYGVGGVVATPGNGLVIEKVIVTGHLYHDHDDGPIGGIVAWSGQFNATVRNSKTDVTIEATNESHGDDVAGIIPKGWNYTVEDTHAHGKVVGGDAAGLATSHTDGDGNSYVVINDSYYAGDNITGYNNEGAVHLGPGDVNDAYWNEDTIDVSQSDGGEPLTTGQMTGDVAKDNMNFDWENTWTVTSTYPELQWNYEESSLTIESQSANIGGVKTSETTGLQSWVGATDSFTVQMSQEIDQATLYISSEEIETKQVDGDTVSFDYQWVRENDPHAVWIEVESGTDSATASWSVSVSDIAIIGKDSYSREAGTAFQVEQSFETLHAEEIDVWIEWNNNVVELTSGPESETINSGESITWEFVVEMSNWEGKVVTIHAASGNVYTSKEIYLSSGSGAGTGGFWGEGDDRNRLVLVGGLGAVVLIIEYLFAPFRRGYRRLQ